MKKTTLCGLFAAVMMTAIAPAAPAAADEDTSSSLCDEDPRPCQDGDADGFAPIGGDCDDLNPETYPGATEVCDGLDNDCNGIATADEISAGCDEGGGCGASIAPTSHHPPTWGGILVLIGALALWRRCRGRRR